MEILGVPYPTDALQNYPGGSLTATGPKETASIFATYPAPYLSLSNGFLDQVGIRGLDTTERLIWTLILLKHFQKIAEEEKQPNSFYKASWYQTRQIFHK